MDIVYPPESLFNFFLQIRILGYWSVWYRALTYHANPKCTKQIMMMGHFTLAQFRNSWAEPDCYQGYRDVKISWLGLCAALRECTLTVAGGTKNLGKIYPVYLVTPPKKRPWNLAIHPFRRVRCRDPPWTHDHNGIINFTLHSGERRFRILTLSPSDLLLRGNVWVNQRGAPTCRHNLCSYSGYQKYLYS